MADRSYNDRMASIETNVLKDACGVFGVASSSNTDLNCVYETLCVGLTALQHRGQESSGVVVAENGHFKIRKGMGLVSNVYTSELPALHGHIGIGHNRYSTAGSSSLLHCQPFVVHTTDGQIAVAHNGELVNSHKLRKALLKYGIGLSTESDSELMTQILVAEPVTENQELKWVERIKNFMNKSQCSYSVLLLTAQSEIYAFRDPFGNRPLCIGEMRLPANSPGSDPNNNFQGMYLVSSESCAFSSVGAQLIRDVEPGEILRITENSISSLFNVKLALDKKVAFCIFEYIYFARPDSVLEEQLVHTVRQECGKQLAIEGFVDADIVSTIPESANPAARAFSLQSGIPYEDVVVKNHYVGRTFIKPSSRDKGVLNKFGPLRSVIQNKRIVLIDDSIVRGTTMPRIVKLLRESGANEVHVRIASPPLKYPCFMGINIPTKSELIANKYDINELTKHIGADSLVYLSLEGLRQSVMKGITSGNANHCTACLDGNYPVELEW